MHKLLTKLGFWMGPQCLAPPAPPVVLPLWVSLKFVCLLGKAKMDVQNYGSLELK
jgi:hypothetical protein